MQYSINRPESEKKYDVPVICYPGHIDKCSKISKTARNILDIILIIMRIDNGIYLDGETIARIRSIAKQFHGNAFALQTIRNVIHELVKNELLLKGPKKNYYVNPTYFMKFSPEKRRKELIEDFIKAGILKIPRQMPDQS